MLVRILEFRARFRYILQKYQAIIHPILRFFVAFVVFRSINQALGYETRLTSLTVELVLSFLGTFTPPVILVLLGAVVSLLHLFAASPLLAVLIACIMLVLYCFIARFSGKYGYVVLAVPILFLLKIPYIIPILLGLIATPMTILPTACGIIVYYLFHVIQEVAQRQNIQSLDDMLLLYTDVINKIVINEEMYATMIVFSVVIVVVYLVRKMRFEYVFEIAIGIGALTCIIGFLVVDLRLETGVSVGTMILGTIGSALIVLVFQFFRLVLDYTATEYVQFEDDDYYYYVKAVPKMNIAVPQMNVKKISGKEETEEYDELAVDLELEHEEEREFSYHKADTEDRS